jgi:glutamate racemase
VKQKIGVIDSGVGGLTVAKEIVNYLPKEDIIYFGDTGRCPYGNRSKEEIKQFTWQMIHYIMKYGLKALVIACNTATAILLEEIKAKLSIPVFGVIEPAAKEAVEATENGKIAVIATTRTIESGAYPQAIESLDGKADVTAIDCPLFVPLIEAGHSKKEEIKTIVYQSLQPVLNKGIDTLVLGCTHYPLIEDTIQEVMGKNVSLVHSGKRIAKELAQQLKLETNGEGKHLFFVSGEATAFQKTVKKWMEINVTVKTVHFELVN